MARCLPPMPQDWTLDSLNRLPQPLGPVALKHGAFSISRGDAL